MIEIKKFHIRNLILSFILGFGILVSLEHFGQFSYKSENINQGNYDKPSFTSEVPVTTKVSKIYYTSFFDTRIETDGNGFDLYDMNYKNTEFNKYSSKSYYYTQASIKDFKYAIYISLGIFITTLFFTQFKIKIT